MSADNHAQSKNGAAAEAFKWHVLISYGRGDRADLARRIVQALRAKGLKVWFDEEELDPGDDLAPGIAEGLMGSRAAAFVISPSSLKSRWVKLERNLAISRWASGDWQGRIIPILAGVKEPPDFLQTKLWVDFADESRFDENIEALRRGILKGGGDLTGEGRGEEERRLLSRMSFLSFFPEGVLVKLYDYLVSRAGVAEEAAAVEQRGLVHLINTDGPELKGVAPPVAAELDAYVTDRAAASGELMTAVNEWIEGELPFEFIEETGVGIGRALLVRDMMALARNLPAEGDEAEEKRDKACVRARDLLPKIVEEGLLRVGLEISMALRVVSGIQRVTDNLMHARVLLRAGDALQAADIFDLYRGDGLFDDLGLGEAERFACALEWAVALKTSRRAGERHHEIMETYSRMLDLVRQMREAAPDSDEPLRMQAELRNNRGTQIAVYGSEEEWPTAEEDFAAAAELYRLVSDDERLTSASANAVAHTLDHFDRLGRKATAEELSELLRSLEALGDYADKSNVGEDLFFFFYQKARVLKRFHLGEPEPAREAYETAALVADEAGLPHRAALARRWVLLLRDAADDISEADYLEGLRACAESLERQQNDAWSYNALVDNYLSLARVLGRRHNKEEAWAIALKAFELDARRSVWKKSEPARARLKKVLRLLNGLSVGSELRESFISQNALLLRALLEIPAYRAVNWEQIAAWSGQQKGADGNSIH